jgi:hypothetical protein
VCGRFTQMYSWSDLIKLYGLRTSLPEFAAVMECGSDPRCRRHREEGAGLFYKTMRWGLVFFGRMTSRSEHP